MNNYHDLAFLKNMVIVFSTFVYLKFNCFLLAEFSLLLLIKNIYRKKQSKFYVYCKTHFEWMSFSKDDSFMFY